MSTPQERTPGTATTARDAGSVSFDNAWVVAVDAGRRRTPGWAALLGGLALLLAALYGGGAVYRLLPAPGASYAALALDRLAGDLCIVGPLLLGAAVMVLAVERRAAPLGPLAPATAGGLGVGAGVCAFVIAVALAAAFGGVEVGGQTADVGRRGLGLLLGAVLVLFQAGSEEIFFRGWLQPVLAARWGPWVGLATTSLLFAAAHGLLQPPGVVAFVNDALAGLAFGLIALRTGGLAAAIGAHAGWNWAEQNLLGLTPNPGVDPLGSLFDLDLRGPGLLSGGRDEMNGSLCATAALLLLIAAFAVLRPGRRA